MYASPEHPPTYNLNVNALKKSFKVVEQVLEVRCVFCHWSHSFFEVLAAPGTKTVYMCKMMCMHAYISLFIYHEI